MSVPSGLHTEPQKVPATEMEWLAKIEEDLHSLRNMIKFFVVLAVLAIAIQGCTVLMSFGR